MENIENIDRLKKEYALLKDCFESDSKYQWVVPTKKILYYLPPIITRSNADFYLVIQRVSKVGDENDTILMLYARSDYGGGAFNGGVGMSTDCPKGKEIDEKSLISLAKEIKQCFYLKTNRALAKAFIEEIYAG